MKSNERLLSGLSAINMYNLGIIKARYLTTVIAWKMSILVEDYTSSDEEKTTLAKASFTQCTEVENWRVEGLHAPRLMGTMSANSCLRRGLGLCALQRSIANKKKLFLSFLVDIFEDELTPAGFGFTSNSHLTGWFCVITPLTPQKDSVIYGTQSGFLHIEVTSD